MTSGALLSEDEYDNQPAATAEAVPTGGAATKKTEAPAAAPSPSWTKNRRGTTVGPRELSQVAADADLAAQQGAWRALTAAERESLESQTDTFITASYLPPPEPSKEVRTQIKRQVAMEAGRLDSKLGGFAASTVYRQLNHQLNQVIVAASKCDDHHFIRCIKPNHLFRPFEVTQPLVLQQLRASSVIEAVKLFASRKPAAQKMVLENASDAMARFIAMLIKAQGEMVVEAKVESAAMRELRETEEEDAKVD